MKQVPLAIETAQHIYLFMDFKVQSRCYLYSWMPVVSRLNSGPSSDFEAYVSG